MSNIPFCYWRNVKMKRKIDTFLDDWTNSNKALLVTGARQVGKTFSIREALKRNGFNLVEINFAKKTDALPMFSKLANLEDFYIKLSLTATGGLPKEGSCIFLDEIQLVYLRREKLLETDPELYDKTVDPITLSKAIIEDGKYKIVFSGSLLGVCLKGIKLNPVGYMDKVRMFPMDFEEYLWSKGIGDNVVTYLNKCYEDKVEVESSIHEKMMSIFREYILVGGMPEAVECFNTTLDFKKTDKIQKRIIDGYKDDVTKYADDEEKLILTESFETLPSELNRKDKHFKKSHLENVPNGKNVNMENAFLWLTSAGIALPTYNVTDPTYPLKLNEQRSILKLFVSDIGLLSSSLLGVEGRIKVINGEKEVNYGAPYENVVAQELTAHGYAPLHYYNSKKKGEIDFVLEKETDILPLEVKSGKSDSNGYYSHLALNNLLSSHEEIAQSFVFSEKNLFKENEKITNLPLYMVMFLHKE